MAPRRYLYHVTPTRNLDTIMETGLRPMAGTWHDREWAARVWLATGLTAAYWVADGFLFNSRHGVAGDISDYTSPAKGYAWVRRDGKHVLWQMDTFSIITIVRPAVVFPDDMPNYQMRRRHRLATVWTPDVVSPSAIIDVHPIVGGHSNEFYRSAVYRRFWGDTPATARKRLEAKPPSYLPVLTKKGKLVGVKRNPKASSGRLRKRRKPTRER
jgi:hypothetical protein